MRYQYKLHPTKAINQGFCRINYISYWEGKRFHHCLQDDGIQITFYLCSIDYEPMYEVSTSSNDKKAMFEKPIGNSELERKVRAWIDNE
jgi:hypothetical protein